MGKKKLYNAICNFEVNTAGNQKNIQDKWRYLQYCIVRDDAVHELIELLTDRRVVSYIRGTSNTNE